MRASRILLGSLVLLASCTPTAFGGGPLPDAASDGGGDAAADAPVPADAGADVVAPADVEASDAPAADAPAPDVVADDAPADVLDVPAPQDLVTFDAPAADAPGPDVVAVDAPDVVVPPADVPAADAGPTPCMSSRMCPGQVCDTGRGYCVDCISAIDCGAGQRCVATRCVDPPPTCRSDRDCSMRNQVCHPTRMECVDCVGDRDCDAGSYCTADSVCRAQVCAPAATTCANATTRRVCNATGSAATDTPCPAGPNATAACAGGTCSIVCATGYGDCDGNALTGCEADLRGASSSCGRCGVSCGAGETCRDGACVAGPCPTGQIRCGGVCRDTGNDAANCGACGTVCSTPNGAPVCASGACAVGVCAAGFGDCNRVASDGCETALSSNAQHCGACGVACGIDQVCSSSSCVPRPCPTGQASCGGACVDVLSSATNCGACGRACASGQTCLLGICTGGTTCGTGLTACGASCVDLNTSASHCGRCNNACASGQPCIAARCAETIPLRFSISWSPTADIDLWVVTPGGLTVNYSAPTGGGGTFVGDSMTTGPETTFWAATPPSGAYTVCAIPYRVTAGTTVSVSWQVARSGAVVASGSRSYTAAAASGTTCVRGGGYDVATYTW